ncbi:uncharacterized protein LOC123551055 [Mercenaria mercenaria]|uniref:uncharacterized protein LOC123551055 n=1 Tax=Mercenaria mercenaria TaxID=6596 RepID=UPI00234E6286|nr:uncharacterized protein LOC123551055 [Mercenaria mercenaria]
MEKYARKRNVKYESETTSLSEVLKTKDFPIVARISKTNELAGKCLVGNKEVLFQRRLKIKCAQVRILDFNDKENLQEAKGIDFIMEHGNFVDNTYLMPMKYNGTLKFVHRPGSRNRYSYISQVLQELPRFVCVEEDTVSMPSNGIGKIVIVPEKTILEVVRKFNENGVTYLQCSDGHDSYAFSEKDRVSFTEVEDEKLYHLFELVRLQLLPKVFKFLDVDPADIVLMNEELNSGLLTMAGGPMELTRFVDVDIIVGWARDNKKKTYETCVIPRNLWPLIHLQTQAFSDQKGKHTYIDRKYGHCIHSDFVERSLYILPVDQFEITWLRSPDLYERNYSGSAMFDVVYIDFQASSEDDDETSGDTTGDFDCPPPLPEKPTKLLDLQVPTQLLHGVKTRNKRKKSKDDRSNIHSQKNITAKQTSKSRSRYSSESNVRDGHGAKHYKKQQTGFRSALSQTKFPSVDSIIEESQYLPADKMSARLVKSSENIRQVSPPPPFSALSCSSFTTSGANSDSDDSDSSRSYEYPVFETFFCQAPDSLQHHSATDSNVFQADVQVTVSNSPNRDITDRYVTTPFNEQFAKGENLISSAVPQGREIEASSYVPVSKESNGYDISVPRLNSNYILETDQTEDRFYQYSVLETSQCFRHCGLGKFADECLKNRLDGSFFRNFDLQVLNGDPFHLSPFEVLKVRKIIFEGWRPNIGN